MKAIILGIWLIFILTNISSTYGFHKTNTSVCVSYDQSFCEKINFVLNDNVQYAVTNTNQKVRGDEYARVAKVDEETKKVESLFTVLGGERSNPHVSSIYVSKEGALYLSGAVVGYDAEFRTNKGRTLAPDPKEPYWSFIAKLNESGEISSARWFRHASSSESSISSLPGKILFGTYIAPDKVNPKPNDTGSVKVFVMDSNLNTLEEIPIPLSDAYSVRSVDGIAARNSFTVHIWDDGSPHFGVGRFYEHQFK